MSHESTKRLRVQTFAGLGVERLEDRCQVGGGPEAYLALGGGLYWADDLAHQECAAWVAPTDDLGAPVIWTDARPFASFEPESLRDAVSLLARWQGLEGGDGDSDRRLSLNALDALLAARADDASRPWWDTHAHRDFFADVERHFQPLSGAAGFDLGSILEGRPTSYFNPAQPADGGGGGDGGAAPGGSSVPASEASGQEGAGAVDLLPPPTVDASSGGGGGGGAGEEGGGAAAASDGSVTIVDAGVGIGPIKDGGFSGGGESGGSQMMMMPVVNIEATDPIATESYPMGGMGSDKAQFTVTRDAAMPNSLTVNYHVVTASSTASSSDYSGLTGSVTILANQTQATFALTATPDNLVEPSESVVIAISSSMMYTIGPQASDDVAILDDPPIVSVHATDPTAAESPTMPGDPGTFTLTRKGGNTGLALSVNVAFTGTAVYSTDYGVSGPGLALPSFTFGASGQTNNLVATVTLNPMNDALVEGEEFASLRILPSTNNSYKIASPVASVLITDNDATSVVDLDIADGQFGQLLGESEEFTRGAYTVANLNDSDGDGRTDVMEDFVVARTELIDGFIVPAGTTTVGVASTDGFFAGDKVWIVGANGDYEDNSIASVDEIGDTITLDDELDGTYSLASLIHGGRDEVDLMQLVVHKPNPVVTGGGLVTVRVVQGSAALWLLPTKQSGFSTTVTLDPAQFPANDQHVLWVEATDTSAGLRDIVLEVEYNGVKDIVRATGIGVLSTGVRHNNSDAIWPGLVADVPPQTINHVSGGFGLRPIDNTFPSEGGVVNAIGFEFTIFPSRDVALDGPWEDDGVRFDITRQIERGIWNHYATGWMSPDPYKHFPTHIELANDEQEPLDPMGDPQPELDESEVPNDENKMYSIDGPQITTTIVQGLESRYRGNFVEFVRVRFDGTSPEGNTVSGSRVSDCISWHATHTLLPDDDGIFWERSTGDAPEVPGTNDIGLSHITIIGP